MSESENKCVKCGGFGTFEAVFGLPHVRCTDCAGTGLADPAAEIAQLRKDAATLAKAFQLQVSYQCACDDAACPRNTTAHRAMARNEANGLCNQINAIGKETTEAIARCRDAARNPAAEKATEKQQ